MPFPFLPRSSLYALVHSSQLQREPRTQLLQTRLDIFSTLDWFAIRSQHLLLCCSLVSEDVSMSSYKDIIALIVQRYYLSPDKLWLWWEECTEKMCSQKSQRCAEVVEDELGEVLSWVTMPWQLLAVNPIAYAEVKGRAFWQVYDCET